MWRLSVPLPFAKTLADCEINNIAASVLLQLLAIFRFISMCLGVVVRFFRARRSLLLENLALRQQLVVLKRRRRRPSLSPFDKLFWVAVSRIWSGWKQALIIVTPETVVRWHRAGFRLYWKLTSRARTRVGRKPTPKEVRELIFQMVVENPTLGSAAHPWRASYARF
jgi:putative transposase